MNLERVSPDRESSTRSAIQAQFKQFEPSSTKALQETVPIRAVEWDRARERRASRSSIFYNGVDDGVNSSGA